MRIFLSIYCVTTIFVCVPHSSLAAINRCVVQESRAEILVLECQGGNEDFHEGTKVKIKTDNKDKVRIER